MLYKDPFVLYLNISVCIILLFLALPSLLNRREELKVRVSFALIFFTVIATIVTNLFVFYVGNYRLVFVGFLALFISLLFGPLVHYYVKNLLGSKVKKGFFISFLPGFVPIAYGVKLALTGSHEQQKVFLQILSGQHLLYEVINLLVLILTLIYCVKTWLFIERIKGDKQEGFYLPFNIKLAWAREFIIYIFLNVLVFLILMLVLTKGFGVSSMNADLIGMPVFMLFVYLLVAVRSMMMFKDFEYQLVLANVEHDRQIQDQRLDISRELHDSMGAQLTFISSILDNLKSSPIRLDEALGDKIDRLSEFSDNSIIELKNTLWVLNSKEINVEGLKTKILNFIKSASEAKEGLKFSVDFNISENVILSSKQAVNLFRATQEILNNAIKYSQATEIMIILHQNERNLKIEIADNGRGFDYENAKDKSFGLANIKSRVAEINGTINLETSEGNGAEYSIEIAL